MLSRRSDLTMEARRIWNEDNLTELDGAEESVESRQGFQVTTVNITGDRAAEELCKPKGRYVTVALGKFLRREDDSFEAGAQVIAELLRGLLGEVGGGILVAGLGNPAITPDAVGHLVVKNALVTRHLGQQMPEAFAQFGDLSALEPGVMGTTGVDSVDVVGAVVREIRPAALRGKSGNMIVTPREIDSNVQTISRLMAYGINLAVHPGLTVRDVDMFLG